jgi:hypothetical protein
MHDPETIYNSSVAETEGSNPIPSSGESSKFRRQRLETRGVYDTLAWNADDLPIGPAHLSPRLRRCLIVIRPWSLETNK